MPLIVTPPPLPFPGSTSQTYQEVPAVMGLNDSTGVPDLIREAASMLESYSPTLSLDLIDILFTDYGNLSLAAADPLENGRQVGDACRAILGTGATPFFLAGDARYTPSAIRATLDRHPDLTVLQIGARANLLETFNGESWHSRTSMKRTIDRLPPSKLKQLGVRTGTKAEFQLAREADTLISANDLPSLSEGPLYLAIDLGIFDPTAMSGVFNPEPGGLLWDPFAAILSRLPWSQIKACDLVGLEPSLDTTGLSTLIAAKAAREVILSLAQAHLPKRTSSQVTLDDPSPPKNHQQ